MDTNHEWEIKVVKDRYRYLQLITDQAKKIFLYEREKGSYASQHHLSVWEAQDMEWTTFKEILNEEQLRLYESEIRKNISAIEKEMTERDYNYLKDIAYQQEIFEYYQSVFLPAIDNKLYIGRIAAFSQDSKVEMLKSEYRIFLREARQQILQEHFRFNRRHMPNMLKFQLMRHKLNYIWPDYSHFKRKMDKPTRTVANYLKKKLFLMRDADQTLERQLVNLESFHDQLYKKYHDNLQGWHTEAKESTAEEIEEYKLMTITLINKDNYGLAELPES